VTSEITRAARPLQLADADGAPVVELEGVGVHFRIPREQILSFKEYLLRRLRYGIDYHELWALKGISLRIAPGEMLGIVGRNGAGKSTLLKVISRVLSPTTGRVIVRGRLAPLLELGAGFHPDLTGRENVIMNATILGWSKASVENSFDQVVEFAELPEFIDAPVRTYSSGMLARLGFSVATLFRPDILVLDEILGVGDVGFQEKCLQRIERFREAGTTVLFVSHSLQQIEEQCERVVWLERGEILADGAPAEVLPRFTQAMAGG
jgi:ABC-2 type transport system ATP-binding protein/lipopolysaccharide transport system ATP-binding protein